MREKILSLLTKEFPEIDFNADVELIDDGVLDSLSVVEIISILSMEYKIMLPYEEIIPENFNSIDAMVAMIKKYVKE